MNTIEDIIAWLQQATFLKPELLETPASAQMIRERMRRHGSSGPAVYLQELQSSPQELEAVVQGVAVGESWLFRYPASFELLAVHLRQLRSRVAAERRLRMLSVGCAAGQEPCSMVIAALHAGWSPRRVRVDAIDYSRQAIADARRGLFSARALRTDRPPWTSTWLQVQGDDVRVSSEVTDAVRWHHADAVQSGLSAEGTAFDVVFCRNVLIYLGAPSRHELLRRLACSVAEGGLLFLGHADRLELEGSFQPVDSAQAFAWRRSCGREVPADLPTPAGSVRRQPRRRPPRQHAGRPAKRAPAPAARPVIPTTTDSARTLADLGDLHGARRAALAAMAADGPDAETLELLGSVHLALGDVAEARNCFRKAVYLDPGHEAARLQLELMRAQAGTPDVEGGAGRGQGK